MLGIKENVSTIIKGLIGINEATEHDTKGKRLNYLIERVYRLTGADKALIKTIALQMIKERF